MVCRKASGKLHLAIYILKFSVHDFIQVKSQFILFGHINNGDYLVGMMAILFTARQRSHCSGCASPAVVGVGVVWVCGCPSPLLTSLTHTHWPSNDSFHRLTCQDNRNKNLCYLYGNTCTKHMYKTCLSVYLPIYLSPCTYLSI